MFKNKARRLHGLGVHGLRCGDAHRAVAHAVFCGLIAALVFPLLRQCLKAVPRGTSGSRAPCDAPARQ